jgi:glycosyltransferase involved in cell wall biosynthesis
MKILFTITYYAPYVSGLTIAAKRIAESLVGKGHEISVLTFQNDPTLQLTEEINGVIVKRVKPDLKISKGFISFHWLGQAIRLIKANDTVIVNLPEFEGLATALFAKIFRKKVISIYHCEISLPHTFINSFIQCGLELLIFKTLFLSDKIITYSDDYAKHSRMLKLFLGKVVCIYPPVIKPKLDPEAQFQLKKKMGLKIHIGILSRLASEKGIEYLLHAIPVLENTLGKNTFKIVLAGPVDPVGEKKYKQKITALLEQYHDNVVQLGKLKSAELGAYYSLLDIFVLPSINSTEAFGIVQVEAMLYGVPVIATDLPGVRVPITMTQMGEVVPIKNCQAIAEAVVKIIKQKNYYQKYNPKVGEIFNLEESLRTYERTIKSVSIS